MAADLMGKPLSFTAAYALAISLYHLGCSLFCRTSSPDEGLPEENNM